MMRLAILTLTLAAVAAPPAAATSFELTNGRWFDGTGFVPRTAYSVDGVLTFERPERIDSSLDLAGGFVVPPFGEAHNHDLASEWRLAERIHRYLWDGVFYVKIQSSFAPVVESLRPRFGRSDSVDVVFAQAPITGPGGHPMRIRELFFDRGHYAGVFESKEAIRGVGYIEVGSREDLEREFPALLAQKPDFVKFMLSHSEEYELRRDDPEFFGYKGLDPRLAPLLVEKAHAAGLRITAHVSTAADFHHAVSAGVDEIAHLPGVAEPEVIRSRDAALAAQKGVTVVTTVSLTTNIADDYPAYYRRVMQQHADNLKRLREAGVTLAVGSDFTFRDTSVGEATLLHELGVFSNLELLRMWTENSPRTIFPERKIGRLVEGYEASFLVLRGDPLEDFAQVKEIRLRFKQGRPLELEPPAETSSD